MSGPSLVRFAFLAQGAPPTAARTCCPRPTMAASKWFRSCRRITRCSPRARRSPRPGSPKPAPTNPAMRRTSCGSNSAASCRGVRLPELRGNASSAGGHGTIRAGLGVAGERRPRSATPAWCRPLLPSCAVSRGRTARLGKECECAMGAVTTWHDLALLGTTPPRSPQERLGSGAAPVGGPDRVRATAGALARRGRP